MLKLIFEVTFHNLNWMTDVWYYLSVPIPENDKEYAIRGAYDSEKGDYAYEWVESPNFGVKSKLLYSILIPNAMFVVVFFINKIRKKECDKFVFGDLIMRWTQSRQLFELCTTGAVVTYLTKERASYIMLFTIQDCFQFYYQLKNSLFIGTSWRYLQAIGFLLSMKGVATRLTKVAH